MNRREAQRQSQSIHRIGAQNEDDNQPFFLARDM
jgi:hypothetical protein